MILLIDNYDSFSYNLFQIIGTFNDDIKVIRNDEMTTDEIESVMSAWLMSFCNNIEGFFSEDE